MLAYQAGIEPVKYTVQFREHGYKPLGSVERDGLACTEAVKHDKRGAVYFGQRSTSTVKLVQAVTRDTLKFNAAYAAALGTDAARTARSALAAHATREVVPQVLCGTGDRATLKHATTKIKYTPTSLAYVVLARWHASRDSIAAYVTVSSALAAVGLAGAIVLPGPVKGVRARSIFL
jgi:hypothetical protein